MKQYDFHRRLAAWLACGIMGAALMSLAIGCQNSQSDAGDPTTRALADPMNFQPDQNPDQMNNSQMDPDQLKKDINHDLQP